MNDIDDIKKIKPFEEIEISDDFMFGEAMKKEVRAQTALTF